jgi:gag-polypeptide of LTR copia-type
VVEKILRSLSDAYENAVCAIEEYKNLAELSVDELSSSLLAYEQRKEAQEERISRWGP